MWWPNSAIIPLRRTEVFDTATITENATFVRVTSLSDVADGITESDLSFRMTMKPASMVFGKSLERFVIKAWEDYADWQKDVAKMIAEEEDVHFSPEQVAWHAFAYMTIYEVDDEKPDDEPPVFRGYLPLDERLLTIAVSDDVWPVKKEK